jgi:hypothetical protein
LEITPGTRRCLAEIAAGADPLEAIKRQIDRDEADDLRRRKAEARALLRKTARKPRQPPLDGLKTAVQADPHRQRVPRRPSIGRMIAQAEKATGKPVTSITLPDGTKLDFSEADRVNPWDRVLPNASKISS